MTTEQKKMKKYTNAVERRLNLPRDVKVRVMSDFISSITARRESGMTDEEIYAEFGSPRKAASDLNEQMKEFTYRKSPWRFLFMVLAVVGGLELLGDLAAYLFYLWMKDPLASIHEASSIGIIGGADGPTAIFLTTTVTPLWQTLFMALLVIVGIYGFLRLRKCKRS